MAAKPLSVCMVNVPVIEVIDAMSRVTRAFSVCRLRFCRVVSVPVCRFVCAVLPMHSTTVALVRPVRSTPVMSF